MQKAICIASEFSLLAPWIHCLLASRRRKLIRQRQLTEVRPPIFIRVSKTSKLHDSISLQNVGMWHCWYKKLNLSKPITCTLWLWLLHFFFSKLMHRGWKFFLSSHGHPIVAICHPQFSFRFIYLFIKNSVFR